MYPCERVEMDFIETAPVRFSNTIELGVTPEQVFEVFADTDSWPHWVWVITKATWTSPKPYGVGSTRTVDLRGMAAAEEFLAWEPNRHMAFRFNECSTRAIAAFAEDYRVEPTPGGCRLTWTVAQSAKGPGRWFLPLARPVMSLLFRSFLTRLRSYTDERYAPAARR